MGMLIAPKGAKSPRSPVDAKKDAATTVFAEVFASR
jgi:hypothetical protein